MKFNVLVALAHLNKVYDGLAAYWSVCRDFEIDPKPYVNFHRALAVVRHDRILLDMAEPQDRPKPVITREKPALTKYQVQQRAKFRRMMHYHPGG